MPRSFWIWANEDMLLARIVTLTRTKIIKQSRKCYSAVSPRNQKTRFVSKRKGRDCFQTKSTWTNTIEKQCTRLSWSKSGETVRLHNRSKCSNSFLSRMSWRIIRLRRLGNCHLCREGLSTRGSRNMMWGGMTYTRKSYMMKLKGVSLILVSLQLKRSLW